MAKTSAGILLYRFEDDILEVLLVHPGGPFWKKRDEGAWSIPKGEIEPGEEPEAVARREFKEELGTSLAAELSPLGSVRQSGGKTVIAFAAAGDLDTDTIESNTFKMEWPPRSGKFEDFPEVDRAEWFNIVAAHQKINTAQAEFLNRLRTMLGV